MRKAATVRVGSLGGHEADFLAAGRRFSSPRGRKSPDGRHSPKTATPRDRRKSALHAVSFKELKAKLLLDIENNKRPYQVLKRWDDALRAAVEDPSRRINQENVDKDQHRLIDSIASLSKQDHTQLVSLLREEKTKALGVKSMTSSSLKSALPRGRSMLHSHARRGLTEEISTIFASEENMSRASVQHVDQQDFQGQSALHYAVLGKSPDAVHTLMRLKANVDAQDDLQETPLQMACRIGLTASAAVVQALIEHGANIERKNRDGKSPVEVLGEHIRGFAKPEPIPAVSKSDTGAVSAEAEYKDTPTPKESRALLALSQKERISRAGQAVLSHIEDLLDAHGLDASHTQQILDAAVVKLRASSVAASSTGGSGATERAPRMVPAAGPTRSDRYRGCLLGVAVCDAVALAAHGREVSSLKQLNNLIGGSAGPLDTQVLTRGADGARLEVTFGEFGVEIGGWSDRTGACLCQVRSIMATGEHRVGETLLRMLRMVRTGEGMSTPGRCPGVDAQTEKAVGWFQRHGWKGGGVTAGMGQGECSSAALARVPPVAMLRCAEEGGQGAVGGAGEDTRSTHGAGPTVDASRYLAAVLCGALGERGERGAAEVKERVLQARFSPVGGLWLARPLVREVREVADAGYKRQQRCPAAARDDAPMVLTQALWALHHSSSLQGGLDLLLAARARRGALVVYGSLAGAVYGVGGLPEAWVELVHRREELVRGADAILAMVETGSASGEKEKEKEEKEKEKEGASAGGVRDSSSGVDGGKGRPGSVAERDSLGKLHSLL